jgi:hypothetical protein
VRGGGKPSGKLPAKAGKPSGDGGGSAAPAKKPKPKSDDFEP